MGFDAESVRRAYDKIAADYADRFGDDLARNQFDRDVLDRVLSSVGASALVVDLGCGPGQVASYIATRTGRAVGVDLTPSMLALARRRSPQLPLVNADLLHLPFRHAGLDAVVAWFSLHNLPRAMLDDALDKLHLVLRPGGMLVVVTHLGDGEEFVSDPSDPHTDPVVITYYQPEPLREALERHRLTVTDIRTRDPLDHEHAVPKIFVTAIAT